TGRRPVHGLRVGAGAYRGAVQLGARGDLAEGRRGDERPAPRGPYEGTGGPAACRAPVSRRRGSGDWSGRLGGPRRGGRGGVGGGGGGRLGGLRGGGRGGWSGAGHFEKRFQ